MLYNDEYFPADPGSNYFLVAMNGTAFVDKLKSLGYPDAEELDGESLDWMFENEEALPFLHWFCSEVGPANFLQQQEVDE